ncbi:hypothetical protein ACFLZE_00655 [Thermodesulfobacteriota bacterium]
MMRRISIVVLFLGTLFLLPLNISYADNAEVMPKGVAGVDLTGKFYFPVDEQFDDSGDVEDVAADFNAELDSSVFPALSALDPFVPGNASIGNSVVSIEHKPTEFELLAQRGITDRLTVGIKIPYRIVKIEVDASLDTSTANVGKNPFAPGGVAPLYAPGTVPFTTADTQELLAQEFGYKPLETWSDEGFLDIEAGLRYQYLKTDKWRLAFTGVVRMPTGEVDDPDNLIDMGFGTGAWALRFFFNNDYTGIENFLFNATLNYDLVLPDKEELRVPVDVNQPITPNKEEVDRDIGDTIKLDLSASYQFFKGSSAFLQYEYGYKFEDSISGNQGFAYDQLEAESDSVEHIFKIGLSYSTIPLYQEKKFPVPLVTSIVYRDRFAGKNVLKTQYIALGVTVYF